MTALTLDRILADIQARELRLFVREGKLRVVGPKGACTPRLLAVLRWRKQEIIDRLCPPLWVPREWLWRTGHRYREMGPGEPHPAGAWWWRYEGETGWRVIEERVNVAECGLAGLRGAALPAGEHLASPVPGTPGPDPQPGNLAGQERVAHSKVLGQA